MNYTSQGTISMQCVKNNSGGKNTSTAKTAKTVFFVPDNGYSIKYRTKSYAVFVSEIDDKETKAIIKKCDSDRGNGVMLSADELSCTGLMFSAAVHQTKVEIQVRVEKEDLRITGITVPAK